MSESTDPNSFLSSEFLGSVVIRDVPTAYLTASALDTTASLDVQGPVSVQGSLYLAAPIKGYTVDTATGVTTSRAVVDLVGSLACTGGVSIAGVDVATALAGKVNTATLAGYVTTGTLATYAPLANPTFTGSASCSTAPTTANHLCNKTYVDLRAPSANPTFSGIPRAPTAANGTSTTQLATTAFVTSQIGNLASLSGANFSGDVNVLGNVIVDGTFLTGGVDLVTQMATKSDIYSPTFTGVPRCPTALANADSTQIASTSYVKSQNYATKSSPNFTGTITCTGINVTGVIAVSSSISCDALAAGGLTTGVCTVASFTCSGAAGVDGALTVLGAITSTTSIKAEAGMVKGLTGVFGGLLANDTLTVTNAATLGTLSVGGAATIGANVNMNAGSRIGWAGAPFKVETNYNESTQADRYGVQLSDGGITRVFTAGGFGPSSIRFCLAQGLNAWTDLVHIAYSGVTTFVSHIIAPTYASIVPMNINYNVTAGSGGGVKTITLPSQGFYIVTFGQNYNDAGLHHIAIVCAGLSHPGLCSITILRTAGFGFTLTPTTCNTFQVSAAYNSGYTNFSVTWMKIGTI